MIAGLRRFAERWSLRPAALRWALPVAWAAMIWWLSSRSPSGRAPGIGLVFLFNGAHVVVFGALAALVHLAQRPRGGAALLVAAALAGAYGAVDELHQSFVPGRHASVFDWASDASGAVLGASLVAWVRDRSTAARRAAWIAVPCALASVAGATFW